jgi:MoaA/NifB/PqqE/SkfB family radical SAM enzyme
MRFRQVITLLRLLFDRRVTGTPRRVFRQLRKEGRLRGEARNKLSRSLWNRLMLFRHLLRWLDGERITRHGNRWVLNTFLPPFPSPAFDRLFTNQLSTGLQRKYTPVSAYLALTTLCPANCWHCSIKNRPDIELPLDIWLRTIDGLHGIGASIFGITGGEPILRADLADIIQAITTGGGEAMLFTTGIGFDAAKATELANAGLWAVCVSLDRTDKQEFEQLRNIPNALETAENALIVAKKAGLYVCINCVVDRTMVSERRYRELYEKAQQLGVDELRLVEPMPCGRLADVACDIAESPFLTPEQVKELRSFHRETNRQNSATKVCAFNEIESPELFGCAAGTRHLFIDSAGEVCPCDFTPLSFGNVAEESIDVIWDRMVLAMKRPRRHCLAQHQTKLLREATRERMPAPLDVSLQTAAAFPDEELPDFVRWIDS